MRRERHFQKLPVTNWRVFGFLCALTRLEQHITGGAPPSADKWRTRLVRYRGDINAGTEFWDPYFTLDYEDPRGDETSVPGPRQLRLTKQGTPPAETWGRFLRDWIEGAGRFAEEELPSNPEFQKIKSDLAAKIDFFSGIGGQDFLNRLPSGKQCLKSINQLFPSFQDAMLPETPNVKLLSEGSLGMAIYHYEPLDNDTELGVFLVVREARPQNYPGREPGLVRDLIYLFRNPTESIGQSVGVYLSSVDAEIYPINVLKSANWRRYFTPDPKPSALNMDKSLELFVERANQWSDNDSSVGLLTGQTRTQRNPSTWKILYQKPVHWGGFMDAIETKLDLVGLSRLSRLPERTKNDLFLQLGPTRDRVIGRFAADSSDQLEAERRRRFAKLTSFTSNAELERRADEIIQDFLGIDDDADEVTIPKAKLIKALAEGLRGIEPTQFMLKTANRTTVRSGIGSGVSAFRHLSNGERSLFFERESLQPNSQVAEAP
jgi:hypothetical protein